MTPKADMWVPDPTTGVFRLATRNEAESAMGDLPEGVPRHGAWVRDQTTGVYRPATRNEAGTLYGGMPSAIDFGEPSPKDRRHRQRKNTREVR